MNDRKDVIKLLIPQTIKNHGLRLTGLETNLKHLNKIYFGMFTIVATKLNKSLNSHETVYEADEKKINTEKRLHNRSLTFGNRCGPFHIPCPIIVRFQSR